MRDDIDAFIDAIVEAAQIPSRRRRDALRRELRSHFEDSGPTPETLQAAVARFGNTARIGDSFRQVYRRDYTVFYMVKVGICLAAATMATLLIETIANVRLGGDLEAWHLAPGFAHAAAFGVVLTVALVAAAEATRAPFTWSRALLSLGCYAIVSVSAWAMSANSSGAFVTASMLAIIGVGVARASTAWTSRAVLTLAACVAAEYLRHQSLGLTFGPIRALEASLILLVLWVSTITIIALSDRAFAGAFRTT